MKRWKFMTVAAIALGLAVGTPAGTYAYVSKSDDGSKNIGSWVSGEQQGPGMVVFEDGTTVCLFCSNNKAEGTMITYGGEIGSISVGMCYNNKQNGMGVTIQKDGTRKSYFCEDNNIKKNIVLKSWMTSDKVQFYAKEKTDIEDGKAIAVYPSGDIYIGDFKDGKRDGWGTYFWNSQKIWYMGEFKDGVKDGVGYMAYPEGGEYLYKSAVWTKDKCQDIVFYYTEDDDIYLVPNKDSKDHGLGVKIKADGTVVFLEYKNGKVTNAKQDVYADKAGNRYAGTDGKKGSGVKVTKKGEIQIGSFKDGRLEGQGFIYSADSMAREEGTYKGGGLLEGVSIKANGTYYKGTFERGNVLYGKGFYRSFRESMEGTFGDYTGIHRIFLKDGSSTTDVLIDGKVKR